MLANNQQINWLPEHIRDGRFGNFLETNVDWALSRERYWGTPLPIWVCEETGHMEAVGNYDELLAKPGVAGRGGLGEAKKANPDLADDLKIHKPYIDAVTYESPKAPGKRMRRVSEVIDCWYDSGAMPFAQWGYPHQEGSRERFAAQFPADFISEAIDQTRGWFYSQLAISTLLFSEDNGDDERHASRRLSAPVRQLHRARLDAVGMVAEQGRQGDVFFRKRRHGRPSARSTSTRSARCRRVCGTTVPRARSSTPTGPTPCAGTSSPTRPRGPRSSTASRRSRSAFRGSCCGCGTSTASSRSMRTSTSSIRPAEIAGDAGQLSPEVLGRAKTYRPIAERGELDQWILSELNQTVSAVTEAMDGYDNFGACGRLNQFVDALSNWYVRRSRDRFWGSGSVGRQDRRLLDALRVPGHDDAS